MATKQMPESGLLKDNSHKAREEAGVSARVQKGPVAKGTMRSRSLAMKFADVFFEGSIKDAVDYMINDVVIPQAKNAILSGIEVLFNGGVGGSSPRNRAGGSVTPYNSYYVGRDGSTRPASNKGNSNKGGGNAEISRIKKRFDPKMIVVEDRGQAQIALAALRDECNEFGQVGVDRLFDLVDISSDWTSTTYGWIRGDLDDAKVRPCGNGWWFDVPEPYPID